MVPRRPGDMSDHEDEDEDEIDPVSENDDSASDDSVSEQPDLDSDDEQEDLEIEYRTEESEDDLDNAEHASEYDEAHNTAPLLPAELLKPLPSPAFSPQVPINIPWERMTREQKVAQRNRDRKRKKRVWDRLRRDSEGTGVLEAGKVAQIKRGVGVGARRETVRSGRVTKRGERKVKLSGRQEILEQRKRDIEQQQKTLLRPAGKQRKQKKSKSAG